MATKKLSAQLRSEKKKRAVARLRKAGSLPGVIYGDQATQMISVNRHDFVTGIKGAHANTLFELSVEGVKKQVLIKDIQADICHDSITHVDFYEFRKGKLLKTTVPVKIAGTSPGVRLGGVMEQRLHVLEVACLPKDIPEEVEINIESLNIGDSLHIKDIEPPKGVQILNSGEQTIVSVASVRGIEADNDEEESAEEEPEKE